MALIKTKAIRITTDGVDVAGFNIRVKTVISGTISYADPVAKTVPFVTGQLQYDVPIPDGLPIGEGNYNIGITAFDAVGNESDIASKTYFFDFTAPSAPSFEII